MLIAAVLLILAGDTVSGKLVGDNVCRQERRYTVNVTEYFLRNSTVRNYKWCLNVPPRCSFYTTKLINDSRVVEKEVTDAIDKCCSGYTEDKDSNRCTPVCPDCLNGTCVEGKCSCFPGFKGERCESACQDLKWGQNCKLPCDCNGGGCHPETGQCRCAPGWTGNNCQMSCPAGNYGPNCQHRCPCDLGPCDPVTGQCASTTSPPTVIQVSSNGKFTGLVTTDPTPETPEIPETPETQFPLFEKEDPRNGQMPVNNYVSGDGIRASTSAPVQIMKPKAKVNGKEVSVTRDENYLSDDAYRGNPEVNRDLVNSASAATAISVGIIIVAAVIVAANHFKKRREKGKEKERGKGVSTVAVYTHSIFHTPLPDPPTFENPIFASPLETNSANEGRFETHVVCSMNFPAHTNAKDPRDYLYDHPPSTGSYRAASIPEPPDIDATAHAEPLYDEIPSGVAPTPVSQPPPSYKSSSVYMNTCGKTRF